MGLLDTFAEYYLDEPSRLSLVVQTEPAVNGYGVIRRYEVKIELQRRHCAMCKLTDLSDPFCPVNGRHIPKTGWVLVSSGASMENELNAAFDARENLDGISNRHINA